MSVGAPGKIFFRKVASISRVSETAKQTVIENDFSPDGGLRPGMVVDGTLGSNLGENSF
jgi:hypothetical protein